MSQRYFVAYIVIIAILIMSIVTGCMTAQQGKRQTADATLTAQVKAALYDDPLLRTRHITVETYDGIVQLSGVVTTSDDIKRAEEVTRRVTGVKSVRNNILVR
ncbi:MAG: BON domain-containing protein [Nitrospirota bacterium]